MTTDELRLAAEMVVATGMNKDWADTIDAGAVAVCRAWLVEHPAGEAAPASEVERVARLMHAAYAEYGFTNEDWKFRSGTFEELTPDSRAAYLAVAAAVIADLPPPAPALDCGVEAMYRTVGGEG
jgi:hypothetical protein